MKNSLCALALMFVLAVCIPAGALGETVTPTAGATAESTAAAATDNVFSCELFVVTLPETLAPLSDEQLIGYESAVAADYPEAAETLLLAANADGTQMALFTVYDSTADCLEAARDAAQIVIGNADAAGEITLGDNRCASFYCATGDIAYRICMFSNGTQILVITMSGLDEAVQDAMLTSLRF